MRATLLTGYGGEDKVRVGDAPDPQPGQGEVLVEVHAAAINPIDLKIRKGQMRILHRHRLPAVMGEDLAGRVVGLGPGASRFRVGDEVFGFLGLGRMGAFAELAAVPEGALALKPRSMSFTEAASLPCVALTCRRALHLAGIVAGQRVFIRAGSGGTGIVAIQLAKGLGAEVITTTSAANVEWVQGFGADRVLDYRQGRFEDSVEGCDLALESSAAPEMLRSFAVVKRGGHVISIGDLPNAEYARSIGLGMFMRAAFGFVGRNADAAAKRAGVHYRFFIIEPDGEGLAELAAMADAGKLRTHVDRNFPLVDTKDALAHVALGRTRGKVVLQVRG